MTAAEGRLRLSRTRRTVKRAGKYNRQGRATVPKHVYKTARVTPSQGPAGHARRDKAGDQTYRRTLLRLTKAQHLRLRATSDAGRLLVRRPGDNESRTRVVSARSSRAIAPKLRTIGSETCLRNQRDSLLV